MGKTIITISEQGMVGLNAAAMLIGPTPSLSSGYNTLVGHDISTPVAQPKTDISFE